MNHSNGRHPTPRRRRLTALLAVAASISISLAIPAAAAQSPTTTSAPSHDLQPLVIGGVPTLNDGFIAALLLTGIADPFQAQFCGGSLVSPNVVITAAHCVDSFAPADFTIAVGQTVLSTIAPTDRIAVADIVIHPLWVPGGFDGVDIALVKLAADVTTVAPVVLETDPVQPTLGRPMVVVGWGAVDPLRLFYSLRNTGVSCYDPSGEQRQLPQCEGIQPVPNKTMALTRKVTSDLFEEKPKDWDGNELIKRLSAAIGASISEVVTGKYRLVGGAGVSLYCCQPQAASRICCRQSGGGQRTPAGSSLCPTGSA